MAMSAVPGVPLMVVLSFLLTLKRVALGPNEPGVVGPWCPP